MTGRGDRRSRWFTGTSRSRPPARKGYGAYDNGLGLIHACSYDDDDNGNDNYDYDDDDDDDAYEFDFMAFGPLGPDHRYAQPSSYQPKMAM